MRIKKKKKKKKAFHLASSDQMLIPWQTKMYHTRQQPLFWIRSRGEGKRVGSFAEQRLLGPRLTKMVGYRKNSRLPEHKALYFVGIWWSTFCCDRYQEKFFFMRSLKATCYYKFTHAQKFDRCIWKRTKVKTHRCRKTYSKTTVLQRNLK